MKTKTSRQKKNYQIAIGIMVFISTIPTTTVWAQRSSLSIPQALAQGVPIGVPVGESVEDIAVNEVRMYFKRRWRRDPNFVGYLQYHLTLQADGRVKSMVGIGDNSQLYLERTNFLRPGDQLVTASDREHVVQIFLNGNGAVGVYPSQSPRYSRQSGTPLGGEGDRRAVTNPTPE